jgi:hypothetical protein
MPIIITHHMTVVSANVPALHDDVIVIGSAVAAAIPGMPGMAGIAGVLGALGGAPICPDSASK